LHKPRLVITEVDMPEMDGIAATRQILQQHPDVYVIGYTMTDEKYGARQMLKAGAHGFLMKNASKAELRYCIEAVHSGSIYICPGCSHLAVRRFSGVEELSDFELLVLQKLVQRKETPQIAAELFAGETTVKRARSRIVALAGTSNPYGIFEWALYYGYISMKTIGEGCRG
jgi:two-component system nitrate/nitrite response regulator NarL